VHVPVRLSGRPVGAFVAWTPPDREIDDTDRSVLHILAGQTAAALQNCALLDHSARLLARTTRQAEDLSRRHAELQATQAELGAARQREVLDSERHRIARELHDSVTQYALSAGMHIELARTEVADVRLRAHLDTAKDLTRRAVEQLRSAIYALHHGESEAEEDLPSMLRRLSGEALFNTAVHADASRAVVRLAYGDGQVRLTIADDGRGRPEEVRRSLRAASVACPSGEHRGLVNMAARARELGGTLSFRRARLGGLQVQVDIPIPEAAR
jgi:signal transduction histidine kinase